MSISNQCINQPATTMLSVCVKPSVHYPPLSDISLAVILPSFDGGQ